MKAECAIRKLDRSIRAAALIVAAAALLGPACAPAAPGNGQAQTTAPAGEYRQIVLDLDKGSPDGTPARLFLGVRDGKYVPSSGYAHCPYIGKASRWISGDGLQITPTSLKGELKLRAWHGGHAWGNKAISGKLTWVLDASVSGDALKGTFAVKDAKFPAAQSSGGAVTGVVRTAAALRQSNAFAPGKDWPFYHGPTSGYAATPSGHTLVDSVADARIVWKSEEWIDGSIGTTVRYGPMGADIEWPISNGGSSPVFADNRVYLYYFVPSGDVLDQSKVKPNEAYYKKIEAEEGKAIAETERRRWCVEADDVVVCMDASTGATIWKNVFPRQGLNHQCHKGGPNNLTPAVAGGMVYAIGSMARVYALDAATGKPVWESTLGPRFEAFVDMREQSLKEQLLVKTHSSRHSPGAPIVADGVAVFPDFSGGLLGLDGKTGKELWRTAGVCPQMTPSLWRHGGKEYVVAQEQSGKKGGGGSNVVAVDPRSGKVLWGVPAVPYGYPIPVAEDCCFARVDSGWACYRMKPDGAQKLWEFPIPKAKDAGGSKAAIPAKGHVYIDLGQAFSCVEIATGKKVAEIKPGLNGCVDHAFWAEDRYFFIPDMMHGHTKIQMFDARPSSFKALGELWDVLWPDTTTYIMPIQHSIVDGRLFVRIRGGVLCLDLRKGRV